MDELTIDERKYISSKRAAEITGYAKDYVGQLCRGGYVPARRIGRNWYVLESAIKDHRFGTTSSESPEPTMAIPDAWETPRYTTLDTELTEEPTNLLGRAPVAVHNATPADAGWPLQGDFQEAWQAWFEMFRERENNLADIDTTPVLTETVAKEEWVLDDSPLGVEDIVAEPVPLQILKPGVLQQPPDIPVLHARHAPVPQVSRYGASRPTPRTTGGTGNTRFVIQTICILVATTIAVTAIFSTGFFDKTIASYERVQLLSGVSQYDK